MRLHATPINYWKARLINNNLAIVNYRMAGKTPYYQRSKSKETIAKIYLDESTEVFSWKSNRTVEGRLSSMAIGTLGGCRSLEVKWRQEPKL